MIQKENPIVEVKNFFFKYMKDKEKLFSNVNLKLYQNDISLLCGPSGSGKTTLAKCLTGLSHLIEDAEYGGEIFLFGNRITIYSTLKKNNIIMVMQNPELQIFGYRVDEEIFFSWHTLKSGQEFQDIIGNALSLVGLEGFQHRNPHELSGGELQKLAIACAIAAQPRGIIFDEPFSMLDSNGRKAFISILRMLKKKNICCLIISQPFPELLELVGNIYALDNGKLIKYKKNLLKEGEKNKFSQSDILINKETYRRQIKSKIEKSTTYIEIERVYFEYPNGRQIFENLSLDIYKGQVTSILGANGSGKTTLALLISKILKPTSGRIMYENHTRKLQQGKVGLSFQNPFHSIFSKTVEEEISWAPKKLGLDLEQNKISHILKEFYLVDFKNKNPFKLSFGQQKLLSIAATVSLDSEVLILDEPDAGLDKKGMQIVLDIIRQYSRNLKAVILVSQDIDFIMTVSDRIIVLEKGKVILDELVRGEKTKANILNKLALQ